ncbi:DASH complex subunit Spc34 [Pleurostoma richardsiae]|uniref:DASH complex subunit SPC34 n=1 Tax=Pleurostoma richardsiae TaxID=41990 RepID=A0AA38S0R7_9PEZI|nr:DASH complex subunit Spc34 [Pleurostoma richardsiae]
MSLLAAHLEHISMSCQGIDSLPFPPPKIFTNALLSNHDITSLIRDTEAHERALFSVPPPLPPPTTKNPDPPKPSSRRQTVFNVAGGEVTTGPPTTRASGVPPRRSTAVAAVLGGDLHAQILRRGGVGDGGKGDVDIEVLLRGAEKLCEVYPLPGAAERIPALRQKHAHQCNTLAYYEAKVAEQSQALERRNKDHWRDEEDDNAEQQREGGSEDVLTEEDLGGEEEEIRELDRKKKELQERLRAMDKDLGGLLNL